MSKHLGAILLSVPVLAIGVASALAASQSEPASAPTLSAPAQDHAAMPAGCNGCTGHDCASCPLAMAAAEIRAPAAIAPDIRCGAD